MCSGVTYVEYIFHHVEWHSVWDSETFLEGHGVSEHLHWPSEPGVPTVERVYGDTQA